MQTRTLIVAAVSLAVGFGIGASSPRASAQQQTGGQLSVRDFPDLAAGLKATPGCLDVKATMLDNGRMATIFAWFENKAALNAWYKSPMHQDAMKKFFPHMPGHAEAIPAFKDEKSPLLVVATVTPSERPMLAGSPLAVSQIAIEVYTPVPGGLAFGGGFGPESLKVPGLRRVK